MKLFTIADLHLSFGVDKPMNIFAGWDNHVERIKENWQKKISDEDIVVLPGDLSWGMNLQQTHKDFEFVNSLNGTKILSKGNHDYWWCTRSKLENYFKENGFDTLKIMQNDHYAFGNIGICGTRGWVNDNTEPADAKLIAREAIRLDLSLKSATDAGLRPVVFLHYPPVYGENRNLDILDVLYKYNVKQVFYGHLHGKAHAYAINGVCDGITYRLISSDFLHFDPMDITKIVQSDNL